MLQWAFTQVLIENGRLSFQIDNTQRHRMLTLNWVERNYARLHVTAHTPKRKRAIMIWRIGWIRKVIEKLIKPYQSLE